MKEINNNLAPLAEKEWREFLIKDIFPYDGNIQRGKRLKKEDHIDGDTPYVSSSSVNNGVDGYVGNNERIRMFKNCITIANSGSVGSSFYHPYNFIASDHVTHLKNSDFSRYNYLFISTLTSRLSDKYNFNREINDNRIKKDKILLPINPKGEPDYEYMERYVKNIADNKKAKYTTYIKKVFAKLEYKEIPKLDEKEWREFKVGSLFQIEKCKCNKAGDLEFGNVPYVGATNRNNGTMNFVKLNSKILTKGGCIVFICDGQGSVGYSVYKREDFIGSTTLKVGRSKFLNSYNAQFFVSALNMNKIVYDYGYKRNEARLKNETILLPTTSQREPDYEYMEQYIMNIKYKKIKKYLDYVSRAK